MKLILSLLMFFILQINLAQTDDVFSRLSAIEKGGVQFYNLDGITFSSRKIPLKFNNRNSNDLFDAFKENKSEMLTSDKFLQFENYKFKGEKKISKDLVQMKVNYLVKNHENEFTYFWFYDYNKENPELEHNMIELILNEQIPEHCFSDLSFERINFAGRNLNLKNSCQWMGINDIQCPYNGEMNWSVHKTKESAERINEIQLSLLKNKNGGKVKSVELVDVIFESIPTKAKKIEYKIKGFNSLLASLSGGKSLTIYYISEKVRGNYVSCVLSQWNNDNINESGLTPLLEEVMTLDN